MSIPGSRLQVASAPAPAGSSKFKGFGNGPTFEEPTTGEKIKAVCAERVFDELPEYKNGNPVPGKTKMSLILCFELEETKEDGTRFIREVKGWPGFSNGPNAEKSTWNKMLKGWAGSKEPLNEIQRAEWMAYINGNSDFDNDYIDPNPPIVGLNCQVVLEYNEKGTFVNIEKIYPPEDGQNLAVSEHYKSYWGRKREREERNSGNNSRPAQQAGTPGAKPKVPF